MKFLEIKFIIGIIIIIGLTGCENKESKYYQKAREEFSKHVIPDIKENWKVYIANALVLKKEEEETRTELAHRMLKKLKAIDPNYSLKESKEESSKWKFWEEVIKASEKYIAMTKDDDIFLEYKITSYEGEWFYHHAMVSMLFVKDKRFAHFIIFFIYTPNIGWKEVDYEFNWPSVMKD